MYRLIHFPFGLGELYTTHHDGHRLALSCWHTDGEWTFALGAWRAYYSAPSVLPRVERRRIGPQLRLL